jgi:hypothetical protein
MEWPFGDRYAPIRAAISRAKYAQPQEGQHHIADTVRAVFA